MPGSPWANPGAPAGGSCGANPQPGGSWQAPRGGDPKGSNPLGLLALGLAVVGTVLACAPVVRPLGWVLLLVALVLGTVAMFRKNTKIGAALVAVAVALPGSGVAAVVGLLTVDNVFTTNFREGFLEGAGIANAQAGGPLPSGRGSDTSPRVREWSPSDPSATGTGSRDEPFALGETIEFSGWEVRVNFVDLDSTDAVMATSELIDPPGDGYRYALINVTLTYTGPGTSYATDIEFGFVSDSGTEIPPHSGAFRSPNPALHARVASGDSSTGNANIQVPQNEEGLLLLTARNDPDLEIFAAIR